MENRGSIPVRGLWAHPTSYPRGTGEFILGRR